MLDLTRKEKCKIEFNYEKADGTPVHFEYEGVVSFATLGVYEQNLKKVNLVAKAGSNGNATIDLSNTLELQAKAEIEMMKYFFADRYDEFDEIVNQEKEAKPIIYQYVIEQIMKFASRLKAPKEEKKGSTPNSI